MIVGISEIPKVKSLLLREHLEVLVLGRQGSMCSLRWTLSEDQNNPLNLLKSIAV